MLQVYFKNKPDTVTDGCFANRMQHSSWYLVEFQLKRKRRQGRRVIVGVYSELGSSVKGAW